MNDYYTYAFLREDGTPYYNGMGFTGWLTILFVGLKLTGYINWPWIWVLPPIWIGLLIVIFFCLLLLIIAALADFRK